MNVKMSHRSRVFKTRVLCKKSFTYSSVFKPYSDVLKPYSGVFLQKKKKIISTRFWEPYNGVFKPYSDVFKPYSGVFLQFIEIEFLKLDFHMNFFPHHTHPLTNRDLKTRVFEWNRSMNVALLIDNMHYVILRIWEQDSVPWCGEIQNKILEVLGNTFNLHSNSTFRPRSVVSQSVSKGE